MDTHVHAPTCSCLLVARPHEPHKGTQCWSAFEELSRRPVLSQAWSLRSRRRRPKPKSGSWCTLAACMVQSCGSLRAYVLVPPTTQAQARMPFFYTPIDLQECTCMPLDFCRWRSSVSVCVCACSINWSENVLRQPR